MLSLAWFSSVCISSRILLGFDGEKTSILDGFYANSWQEGNNR